MKSLIFCFIIAVTSLPVLPLRAQEPVTPPNIPVDPDSRKILYREVVQEKGDPGYLYIKAMEWFNCYYSNPISVLRIQDQVNGRIEGTGRMNIYYDDEKGNQIDAGLVLYTILLEFKDDRYRFTLTDFTLKAASRIPLEKWLNQQDPAFNPLWNTYLYQVDTTMQRLVSTLKEKMKPVEVKTDEW